MKMRSWTVPAGLGAWLVVSAGISQAVVKHAVDDSTAVAGPAPEVVGRWNTNGLSNASVVAISPNYILTARHQNTGGVGSAIEFGGSLTGVTYKVAEIINVGAADLRIARITLADNVTPANLTQFTPVYSGSDAAPLDFTLGGFGKSRGADLTATIGGTHGYQWLNEANTTLRFGRNRIDGPFNGAVDGPYTNDVLIADFDGSGVLGPNGAITSEAIAGEFDSGGGWFVENGVGNWQVAGIVHGVEHFGSAWFASNTNAAMADPDGMDAIRLSSYRTFINNSIPEPTGGALLLAAGAIASVRRKRR